MSEVQRETRRATLGLVAVGVAGLAAGLLLAWALAGSFARPLRRLADTSERLGEGDLSARTQDVTGAEEIEQLGRSFDEMADRLERTVRAQREFVANASHQLRTPLTALRLRLDRAADLMTEDEPAMGQVDAARDEIDRLQRLVDGLLVLARADRRDQHAVPVDVSAVAADRVADWQALAGERQVHIELDTPGMAVALAVPGAVEQIVDNYLDNALEVVPEGSRILVSVRADPSGVVLTVDDQGPGLPAEARDRAFDRFWRGSQDGSGSGLGLAIVSALAQAGGGSVWLDASPLGGVRAAARFRTQPPAPHPREASGRHR
jgi:signal transduction histidine kinase